MSDLIRVVDLEVQARIGVPEEERAVPQRLLVSVEMRVRSFAAAAKDDDLAGTVNYADVAERLKSVAAGSEVKLIESLAEKMARVVLAEFAVESVRLEIKKFILTETRYVAVEIERVR
jgi:FolB domain-containing protein